MGGFAQPVAFLRSPELMARSWSREEAFRYTRWLATHHYENFQVVSFLLPRRLHQDFYNVYAFCRWSDDLGDELGSPAESLRWLGWWRTQLDRMGAGEATHPVLVALRETVARHRLTLEPFADLIRAFVQDQQVTHYPTFEQLYGYCRYSANPVGRIVLGLFGYHDQERLRLSDATCTALQLANFWQDVAVDLAKHRVYLPLELLDRHGYTLEELYALRFTPAFAHLMREAVGVARRLFQEGLPLVSRVDRRLALDVDLFSRGGLRVLDKIAAQGYNVLARRPAISKLERAGLLAASLVRLAWGRAA